MKPAPDLFERLARGLRAAYSVIAKSQHDVKRMDDVERASAEMTTYALGLAYTADECGMPPEAAIELFVSCLNDVRRQKGRPELQTFKVRTPSGAPS